MTSTSWKVTLSNVKPLSPMIAPFSSVTLPTRELRTVIARAAGVLQREVLREAPVDVDAVEHRARPAGDPQRAHLQPSDGQPARQRAQLREVRHRAGGRRTVTAFEPAGSSCGR